MREDDENVEAERNEGHAMEKRYRVHRDKNREAR